MTNGQLGDKDFIPVRDRFVSLTLCGPPSLLPCINNLYPGVEWAEREAYIYMQKFRISGAVPHFSSV
jgi:hypothetical protein